MRKRIRISLAAAIVLLAAIAVPLIAQGPPQGPPPMGGIFGGPGPGGLHGGPMGRGPMGPGPGLGDLGPALHQAGITEDQQQQIKNVVDSHRDEFRAIGERMRTVHEGVRAVIEADTIDENAIRAKTLEVAAVEADQMILGAKVRAEVLALLTPEQLEKVKAFRAEMQKRIQQGPRRRPERH